MNDKEKGFETGLSQLDIYDLFNTVHDWLAGMTERWKTYYEHIMHLVCSETKLYDLDSTASYPSDSFSIYVNYNCNRILTINCRPVKEDDKRLYLITLDTYPTETSYSSALSDVHIITLSDTVETDMNVMKNLNALDNEFIEKLSEYLKQVMRDKWIKEHQRDDGAHDMTFNGLIAYPCFDPQYLENGALLQIRINKISDDWSDFGFFEGTYINAFVRNRSDHNTKLHVYAIDSKDEARTCVFDVKDVTKGYIEITRVK
jgi:hypothetical protein